MTNARFTEIARNVFRAGNIQVLNNKEYEEFMKECRRMFVKMPVFEIIENSEDGRTAFRELNN